jgi:M6 family metalloprotease-like protein
MSAPTVATGFTKAVAITYSANRNVAVVGERGGRLTLLDLLRPIPGGYEQRLIGEGYADIDHLAYDDVSDRLVIADADGVWVARLAAADRVDATAFAHAPVDVRALSTASVAGAPVALVLDGAPSPHVDSYNLGASPGVTVDTLLDSLDGARDAAIADSTSAFLLTSSAAGIILQLADWSTSTVTQMSASTLPFGGHVAALDSQWALVVSKNGEFACVRRDGALRRPAAAGSPTPVTAVAVTKEGHVLMATGDSVLEDTLPSGIREAVLLTMASAPIFIGGYAAVHIDVTGSGLTLDQIHLSVEDSDLGAISPSRDSTFDVDHPHLLLTGGWKPGTGEILAKEVATGMVVGRANFRIDERWDDTHVGPSFSVTGRVDNPVVRPAWGGGDAGVQNVDVYKAPAKWRVAIVMVDTTTNVYPTVAADLVKIRKNWFDNYTGGVASGGVTRSVTGYYTEVSYGKLTMSLVGNAVAGPVHATGSWDDLFELETIPDPAVPGGTLPRRWNPKPDTWKTLVSTLEQANAAAVKLGNPQVVDFGKTDAVAFVVRTVNVPAAGVNPPTSVSIGRFVWPQQTTMTVKLNGKDTTLPMLVMPENWTAIDGRQVYETLAHELGHTLQLPDLYLYPWMNQGLAAREVGPWDLMCNDGGLPQLSLPSRMALGWVGASEVKAYNFAANHQDAVLEQITLQALETKTIPANTVRGAEIRLAPGRNYYFEYRSRQGASLGDASLPLGPVVVGTDVVSPKGAQNLDSRVMTMRLEDDPDAVDDTDGITTQGAFLTVGKNYKEPDFTEGAPKDFIVTTKAIRPDSADVEIRYNSSARPELSIRTWPNGDNQWQSPDIEIRNEKSNADPKWLNVPWAGQPNTIVAKVTNRGRLEAKDVKAFFSSLDFTTNGEKQPAAQPLGTSAPVTIPPGQTRELTIGWVPPGEGHFCITVNIPLYEAPGDPATHESSDRDNFAQSNYTKFWSESASPSTRVRFPVKLENPTNGTVVMFPQVRQTQPYYRTYLEHSWLRLGPHESADVMVMTESLVGDPAFPSLEGGAAWESPNQLEISGWVSGVCAAKCTGGAAVQVNSGRTTTIRDIQVVQEPGVLGRVQLPDDSFVGNGTMLAIARRRGAEPGRDDVVGHGEVHGDGRFFVSLNGLERGMEVRLNYLPGPSYAPCEAGPIEVDF